MDNKSLKINVVKLEIALLAVLAIAPDYVQIANLHIGTILTGLVAIVGILLLKNGKVNGKLSSHIIVYFCWSIYSSVHFLIAGSVVEALLFFIKTIFLYFILNNILSRNRSIESLFYALEMTSVIVCCIGIIEEIFHVNLFSFIAASDITQFYNRARFGMTRIIAFSNNTINYGCYLYLMTGISTYCINSDYSNKKFYRIAYLLQWINLFFTFSRSIIIIGICANLLLNYLLRKKKLVVIILKYSFIAVISFFVVSILFPSFLKMVKNVFYMIIAVFDSSFIAKIANTYGAENINAFGERKQLFLWVFDSMGSNWLFGNGVSSSFNYAYSYNIGMWTVDAIKKSIENQYLYVLYHKGLLGLALELLVYLSILKHSFRRMKASYLNRVNNYNVYIFSKCIFVTMVFYMIQLLGVSRQSEDSLFLIIITSFFVLINKERSIK